MRLVDNPRWAEGQATSLAAGIDAARAAGHRSVVVGLADQPLIGSEAWRAVAVTGLDRPMGVATYAGQRRNPVRLDRWCGPSCPMRATREPAACWPGGRTRSARYRARVNLPMSTPWRT